MFHSSTILNRIKNYCNNDNNNEFNPQRNGRRPRLDLPIDEICKLYESKISADEIAEIYDCSRATIINRLHEVYDNSGCTEKVRSCGRVKKELPMDEIYNKYNSGVSFKDISKLYGVSSKTVLYRLRKYCEENNLVFKLQKGGRKLAKLPINDIRKLYESNVSAKELSSIYGYSRVTILNRLHEFYSSNDIKGIRTKGRIKIDLPMDEIYKLYMNNYSFAKIARYYNCSSSTISSRIKEYCNLNKLELNNKYIDSPSNQETNTVNYDDLARIRYEIIFLNQLKEILKEKTKVKKLIK